MSKQDHSPEGLLYGHATSIEWLIASIDVNGGKTCSPNSDVDDESPNEMLVRRITGVEPRWWASVLLFTAVWLVMLYVFGFIADEMRAWPRLRFGALLGFLVAIVYVSREFGARFRVLNDRSSRAHETTWAMLSGWLLIGIVSVISEPMKKLASDLQRYDTMTAVALVSWIYLYNATLKLPWDKATEQRKSAHLNWEASLRRLLSSTLTMKQKLLHAALAPGDQSLHQAYHRQLVEWDKLYPEWRAPWQRSHSVSVMRRHDEHE
ncbi:hypothetical protein [Sphingomonas echinoides]|uniref:hypothetical protein n=1 Tax=Sphingomonas echinoides TaxID=59803 RepID=UPI002413BA17|nr:hypothetical protein [Sphingomonas echinoides]